MSWNTCKYPEIVELYNSGLSRRAIGRRFHTSHSQISKLLEHDKEFITRDYIMPTLRQRFESFVMPEPMSGCWLWTGAMSDRGYGQIGHGSGSAKYAHRVSYELHKGKIGKGLFVCHHCDNPICVNPDHLFLGTAQDNVDDMHKKGRAFKVISELKGVFGESHPASKLKESDVRTVRLMRKDKVQVKEIVKATGLNKHAVHAIIYRPIWSHVKV